MGPPRPQEGGGGMMMMGGGPLPDLKDEVMMMMGRGGVEPLPDLKDEVRRERRQQRGTSHGPTASSRGGGRGSKHEDNILEFNWRSFNEAEFDVMPPEYLYCQDCNIKVGRVNEVRIHICLILSVHETRQNQ